MKAPSDFDDEISYLRARLAEEAEDARRYREALERIANETDMDAPEIRSITRAALSRQVPMVDGSGGTVNHARPSDDCAKTLHVCEKFNRAKAGNYSQAWMTPGDTCPHCDFTFTSSKSNGANDGK